MAHPPRVIFTVEELIASMRALLRDIRGYNLAPYDFWELIEAFEYADEDHDTTELLVGADLLADPLRSDDPPDSWYLEVMEPDSPELRALLYDGRGDVFWEFTFHESLPRQLKALHAHFGEAYPRVLLKRSQAPFVAAFLRRAGY